jgi:hypothetical protein
LLDFSIRRMAGSGKSRALALGQLVGDQPPSIWLILTGLFGWLFLVGWGLLLTGDRSNG